MKSRLCSKEDKHPGKCDSERKYYSFWKYSVPSIKHSLKREFNETTEKMEAEHQTKLARVVKNENKSSLFGKQKLIN